MTLSIIVPDVRFSRRSQVLNIPAIAKNHVFSVFGADRDRSLMNMNVSEQNAVLVGTADFSKDGVLIKGNTNSVRFKGLRQPSSQGCTLMVVFKTGPVAGDAGLVSLWSEAQQSADPFVRRLFSTTAGGMPVFNSAPAATTANSNRPLQPNTEYILSMTRAIQGTPSQIRQHNLDGTVAVSSPLPEYVGMSLPYAADTVFDVGLSSSGTQLGVYIRGVALWTGAITETDIAAAAALLYQASRT